MPIKVTVWNEFRHEKSNEEIKKVYEEGIHSVIAKALSSDADLIIRTATLDDPDCGLDDATLADTDVLIWWAHKAHDEVSDSLATRIQEAVLKGMGFIPLHSSHFSKPFMKLMGTSCTLKWRDNDRERVWNVNPSHPIAQGIPDYFELQQEEMYGEQFDIPTPDDIVFMGWFAGGEVFRSGCTFTRGHGRIFYFQPGHEAYPIYYNEHVRRILINAVKWAAPIKRLDTLGCTNFQRLEK